MMIKRFIKRWFALMIPSSALALQPLAFFYGQQIPMDHFKQYEQIVVTPNPSIDPARYDDETHHLMAYVAISEIIDPNQYGKPIDPAWILGQNPNWNTWILDQSNPEWRHYFIENIITPLWNQGYRGFFIDTLDSYQLVTQLPTQQFIQQQGLILLIKQIKQRFPEAKLIINRGFELVPIIYPLLNGVVAESLYSGWNNAEQRYYETSIDDQQYLIQKLEQVQAYGLPVTVIDYLDPAKQSEATSLAQKIATLNFYPWITNADLTAWY